MFKKYPSIENSYRDEWINRFIERNQSILDQKFVRLEKIDGANISFCFEPNKPKEFKHCSRTQNVSTNFFNWGPLIEKHKNIIDLIQNYSDVNNVFVNFYGELFGQGIQNRVNYGNEKYLRFFDVSFNGEIQSFIKFRNFMLDLGIEDLIVPVLGYCTFDEIFKIVPEFDSKILGIKNNFAEGEVVRPLNNEFLNGVRERFILKIKNEKFKENNKKKNKTEIPKEVIEFNRLFLDYINENRLNSVFSKEGIIEDQSQIGKYIGLLIEDAKEDFLKDYNVDEFNKKDLKRIFNIGQDGFKLLSKYL